MLIFIHLTKRKSISKIKVAFETCAKARTNVLLENVGPYHGTSTISITTTSRLLWKSFIFLGLRCAAL